MRAVARLVVTRRGVPQGPRLRPRILRSAAGGRLCSRASGSGVPDQARSPVPDDNVPSRRRFLTGRIRGEQPFWRPVPTIGASPNDVLWGVWCDGSDHALIVGDGGAIHRLKDGVWRREESGVKEPLHAVAGFGDGNAGNAAGNAPALPLSPSAGWGSSCIGTAPDGAGLAAASSIR